MTNYTKLHDLLSNERGFKLEVIVGIFDGIVTATVIDEEGNVIITRDGGSFEEALESLEAAQF